MTHLWAELKRIYRNLIKGMHEASPPELMKRYQVWRKQSEYLNNFECSELDTLIIFLAPGLDVVNGGIMSISSIAEESKKIIKSRRAGVFVCPLPGDKQIFQYTKFKNDIKLVDYRLLIKKCSKAKNLIIHIPEYYLKKNGAGSIISMIDRHSFEKITFNMMLQNIKVAPQAQVLSDLKRFGGITITTAHKAYSGADTEAVFGCPVHYLSVWISPASYHYLARAQKRDLVVVSPDNNPSRDMVLNEIMKKLPNFEFRVIKNLTYEQYKELISVAKYSITFGEGLDGYFIEPVYSGGIGSAVFNSEFFTDEYRDLPFIYTTFEDMAERFADEVIRTRDNDQEYLEVHNRQFSVVSKNYVLDEYLENIYIYYAKYHHEIDLEAEHM